MRWYVIQAFSGFEKQVQRSLKDHISRNGMEESFGAIEVPTEVVIELKSGQKRTSERKFFPGYVLVQMKMSRDAWHLVNSVPRVSGFVGDKQSTKSAEKGTGDDWEEPPKISDEDVNSILQQVQEGAEHPRPKYTYAPGEVVRVVDGPFQDFNGMVEDVNFDKERLRVSVTIFGRSTPVELAFSQVEKG